MPGGVQGLDRYAYANNNPVRYTDPSGHWAGGSGGAIHDSDGGGEFFEVLTTDIKPSRYLDKYHSRGEIGAQYVPLPNDPAIHHNLCGQISLEVVDEAISGGNDELLSSLVKENDSLTSGSQLGDIFSNPGNFPSGCTATYYAGWHAEHYQVGVTYDPAEDYQTLSYNFGSTQTDYQNRLTGMIRRGSYIIVTVWQNLNTGRLDTWGSNANTSLGVQHWVVVCGVSKYWVRIYNPYVHDYQYYSWDDFYEYTTQVVLNGNQTIHVHDALEIRPPAEPEPIYGDKL